MPQTDGLGNADRNGPIRAPTEHGPHSEYYRQAAQHFGAIPAERTTMGSIAPLKGLNRPVEPSPFEGEVDPILGGDAGMPTAPQADFRQRAEDRQGGPSSPRQDSDIAGPPEEDLPWVHRLMLRGTRGELIPQPWFRKAVQDNADTTVFVTYGGAFLFTLLLNTTVSSAVLRTGLFGPSSILSMLLIQALWVGVGYVLLAIGTNLAHRFLMYGLCLVGVLVSLASIWSAGAAISLNNSIEASIGSAPISSGLLVFAMLANVTMGVALVYVGVQVRRGVDRIPPQS